MSDLDDIVRTSLTTVADDDVHVERLLAGARAEGLRRRRRQRFASAAGVVAGIAVVTVAATVALRPAHVPDPASVPSVLPTGRPLPGAVSPLQDPGVLGAVPALHLSMTSVPFEVSTVAYDADNQFPSGATESMSVDGTAGEIVDVGVAAVAQDSPGVTGSVPTGLPPKIQEAPEFTESVLVGGRPGTFERFRAMLPRPGRTALDPGLWPEPRNVLTWQLDGHLRLRMTTTLDEPQALAQALNVRLDRAHACGPAYRMPSPPPLLPDLRYRQCQLEFKDGRVTHTRMMARSGESGSMLYITVDNASDPGLQPSGLPEQAVDLVNGRPMRVTDEGRRAEFGLGGAWVMVEADDAAIVQQVAGTIEPLGFDPANWPG
jgi:hypothetical protein